MVTGQTLHAAQFKGNSIPQSDHDAMLSTIIVKSMDPASSLTIPILSPRLIPESADQSSSSSSDHHLSLHSTSELASSASHAQTPAITTIAPLPPLLLEQMATEELDHAEEEDELEILMHWFVLHDSNGDGLLDGQELMQAFEEWSMDSHRELDEPHQTPVDIAVELVDHVLKEDDRDDDGKVSIDEFLNSQHH